MNRLVIALAGVAFGAVITLLALQLRGPARSIAVERDIVATTPVSAAELETQRAGRFADLDSIESLASLPSDFARAEALYAVAGRSGIIGLEQLARDALRIADDVWRAQALAIVFSRIVEIDADFAVMLLGEPVFRSLSYADLQGVVEQVGRVRPFAALELQARTGQVIVPTPATREMLERMAADDLDAALRIVAAQQPQSRGALAELVAAEYARQRPQDALRWALGFGGVAARDLVAIVLERIAEDDPPQALQAAHDMSTRGVGRGALSGLIDKLVEESPRSAAGAVGQIRDTEARAQVARTLVRAWLEIDAAAAMDWAFAFDPDVAAAILRDPRMADQVDLDAAPYLLARIPPEMQSVWLGRLARRTLNDAGADAALGFIAHLAGTPEHDRVAAQLGMRMAGDDPVRAADLSLELPAGPHRDAVLLAAVSGAGVDDPGRARRWLSTISDADLQVVAAATAFSDAYGDDDIAARDWLEQLPAGIDRDQVIANVVLDFNSSNLSPDEKARLIAQIRDPEIRLQIEDWNYIIGSQGDVERELEALDRTGLPEALRQQLKAQAIGSSIGNL